MREMTLPCRHRIRNSNPGGLRPSYLSVSEAPHNIESLRVRKSYHSVTKATFLFLTNRRDRETNPELRARYLAVTEAPNNIESLRVSWKETFCFFKT